MTVFTILEISDLLKKSFQYHKECRFLEIDFFHSEVQARSSIIMLGAISTSARIIEETL